MQPPTGHVQHLVDHLFRQQAGRMVATLTRLFGIHNLELAEDTVQDTLQEALQAWGQHEIPDNPAGWLMVVAKRKAINTIKRDSLVRSFAKDMDAQLKSGWTASYTMDQVFLEDEIRDSQLRMIFTCCHAALSAEAQVALTLKTLCGFKISEIAAALLTTEANINKRLYRAKEKIRNEPIDFAVPFGRQLAARIDSVLLVIYLLFNEGYNASGDQPPIRRDLCLEGLRLARLLIEKPVTAYPSVYALLALMCFHAARFDARMDDNNDLIVLEDQDRNLWNPDLIGEGCAFLAQSASGEKASTYHLEAAIAAEHCLAPDFAKTNWQKIHEYYTALEKLKPSSVIQLNLAIAAGKRFGPEAAIGLLHGLEQRDALTDNYLLPATLGEFYFQTGQPQKALPYFSKAKSMVRSAAIADLLQRKINKC